MNNTNEVDISVIVPVFNAERYLSKCMDSLLKQTIKNIEIIAVNDASEDNSYNILEEYSKINQGKIHIVNLSKRRGPGGARNAGIKIAKGKYIGFVDSDDDVKCSMYEILFKAAKKGQYDIVDSAFFNEFAMQNMRTIGNNAIGKLSIQKKKDLMLHAGFIWSKIIKRDIIIDNNIRFRENEIYEDIDFIRLVILYSKKIYAVDKVLYNYRNNSYSVTNCLDSTFQIESKMKSMKAIICKFKELNVYETYKDEMIYLAYKTYISMIDIAVSQDDFLSCSNLCNKLRKFFFEICDESYTDNKYIKALPKEQRVFADLNNFDSEILMKHIKNAL